MLKMFTFVLIGTMALGASAAHAQQASKDIVDTAVAAGSYQMAMAQDAGQADNAKLERAYAHYYSPYAQRDYPTRPLFGETHLHTMSSFDAGAFELRLVRFAGVLRLHQLKSTESQ